MIGTNNIGSGHLPEQTSRGVLAVARWLLDHTQGQVLLVKLLPRGDHTKLKALCPPRCDSAGRPYSSFKPAIDRVNTAIEVAAVDLAAAHGSRFQLVDCNAPFVTDGGPGVRTDLMPDMLHVTLGGVEFGLLRR